MHNLPGQSNRSELNTVITSKNNYESYDRSTKQCFKHFGLERDGAFFNSLVTKLSFLSQHTCEACGQPLPAKKTP